MSTHAEQTKRMPWFVVFPDHTSGSAALARLTHPAPNRIDHPSGRPWIVGQWLPEELSVGTAGSSKVVLLGLHGVTGERLERVAHNAGCPGDLDAFAATVDGSWHLLASIDGTCRVQGSITKLRRVFHTVAGRDRLAGNRANVLAELIGDEPDPARLALHLLAPTIPHPLGDLPVWPRLAELAGTHYLSLPPTGRAEEVRWWSPPEPVLPMRQGATGLRTALQTAIEVRTVPGGLVAAELGGVDSTGLCSLLSAAGQDVRACTMAGLDPYDDDLVHARRTVAGLGNVTHEVLSAESFPLYLDNLPGIVADPDEPDPLAAAGNSRQGVLLAWSAAQGARNHYGGYGGDEVLSGGNSWLMHYYRTSPALALRNLRASRANGRWSWKQTTAMLLDRTPYSGWLRRQARALTEPVVSDRTPDLGWGYFSVMAGWATPEAVDAVRGLVLQHAEGAEPLSPIHGMHEDLSYMKAGSRYTGQLARAADRHGLTLHAPYYDNRVIEAALSIRPEDRVSRWAYKPIMAEAMRGIVPMPALRRDTKGEGSAAEDKGIEAHRAEIVDFLAESRVAELGLVDQDHLLRECAHPSGSPNELGRDLYPLIAAEVWLRSATSARARTAPTP
ncbi:asparagine synthase [Streptomyces sp. P38-E01]|uniref:Asparagine synthase n=1 Tax=Streptomyces tardus TaxID=2780544 RepID=A0A949JHV9_9ACTN|nr:asparagine synthase-related protein [Streptomyces tardus]MBU7600431.1 asparagine synthase [Streptomyces tardus]